ncbi:MAG: class I SAM-dependent methyltransferase [Verrucomicrobia subdivision 3 bacterium]|nr:class I SAM-dependent methyltransferase [Limisphaerales bacterium]
MNIAYRLARTALKALGKDVYLEDALVTTHNHDFVSDVAFQSAYNRGLEATHGRDYHFRWRVHVALWVGRTAAKLPGDFVECGVNYGFVSSAMMHHLAWDTLGKTYYLLDRFDGFRTKDFYVDNSESVQANFAKDWKNFKLIKGLIPETLSQIDSSKIAYLHLDLNVPEIEAEALKILWPRLVSRAMILMDDYAYAGSGAKPAYRKLLGKEMDDIVSLPTGQGLLIKP